MGCIDPFSRPTSKLKFDKNKHGFTAFIKPLFTPETQGVNYENSVRIPNGFYTISFECGKRDDKLAQRIVDALWASLAIMGRVAFEEMPFALCVPKCLLRSESNVIIETLVAWYVVDNNTPYNPDFLLVRLGRYVRYDSNVITKAWKILPALMQNNIFKASQFMFASIQDFNFIGDDTSEILRNPDLIPLSFNEQVRAEGAILNAYKAIEALIGDPPKDDAKLKNKLISIGVDPGELVGFRISTKEPVLQVIRRLNEYRDRKTVHGSTPYSRETKYVEVYEFQECTLVLLSSSIDKYLR